MVSETEWARLFRVARMGAGRWDDASVREDAAQDAVVALLIALREGRRISDPEVWVAVKAYWRARALSRSDLRRKVREKEWVTERPPTRETRVATGATLEGLPETLRQILEARAAGKTVREIAGEMHISRSAVQRGVEKLRAALDASERRRALKAG